MMGLKKILLSTTILLNIMSGFSQTEVSFTPSAQVDIMRKETGIFQITTYGKISVQGKKTQEEVDTFFTELENNLKNNPYINGVAVVTYWSHLESNKDQYNFAPMIRLAKLLKKYDKGLKMIIIPGIRSPKWVKDITETITSEFNDKPTIQPVPWDLEFKKHWKDLLTDVRDALSSYDNFVAISIAGANNKWAETDMARDAEAVQQWEKYGDYRRKTTDFWKEMVHFFSETFKEQHISIHIRTPFSNMYPHMIEIIDEAMITMPERFTLQNCQLTGTNDNFSSQTFSFIYHYKDALHVGFQSLTSELADPTRFGTREMLIMNLVQGEAQYVEMFSQDAFDIDYTKEYYETWNEAKEMGFEAYKQKLIDEGKYIPKNKDGDFPTLYSTLHQNLINNGAPSTRFTKWFANNKKWNIHELDIATSPFGSSSSLSSGTWAFQDILVEPNKEYQVTFDYELSNKSSNGAGILFAAHEGNISENKHASLGKVTYTTHIDSPNTDKGTGRLNFIANQPNVKLVAGKLGSSKKSSVSVSNVKLTPVTLSINRLEKLGITVRLEDNTIKVANGNLETIYNSIGQEISNSNLQNGIYFVKVSKGSQFDIVKIIK